MFAIGCFEGNGASLQWGFLQENLTRKRATTVEIVTCATDQEEYGKQKNTGSHGE